MTRSKLDTFLEYPDLDDRFSEHSEAHDEWRSCLACGASIGSEEPTIKIRGALVHTRCAMYQRRGAGR